MNIDENKPKEEFDDLDGENSFPATEAEMKEWIKRFL
jgi:hypothetical protein